MGARGPAPTPTHVLALRGSRRAKERITHGEPLPAQRRPKCPGYFSAAQKKVWRELVAHVEALGCLATSDALSIERLAVAVVRYRDAVEGLGRTGEFHAFVAKSGAKIFQPTPHAALIGRLTRELNELGAALGLSPAARTRLRTGSDGERLDPAERTLLALVAEGRRGRKPAG